MNERPRAWPGPVSLAALGPTISFAFNLGKIPDQGEDSDPILRDGPDLGLLGVFDGMGGAGGTVYETPEGRRTGAYLASRIARDVVEQRMLDLLEPDWHLNGKAAARNLQHSVRQALKQRLQELNPAPSSLRSRLIRALPTTMAVVALQRTQPGGPTWAGHVFWAGDSRAYVFESRGASQLSTDDLRDPGDALANLRRDSVVSNALSADTEFHINYRRVELRSPFLVVCATDGCFGYVRTPMHFEYLVLSHLLEARNTEAWSSALQAEIAAVTGDDAAMSTLGVGADLKEFQKLFSPRVGELASDFIEPLDELSDAVTRAEQELRALQSRQLDEMTEKWNRYKSEYERYLRPEAQMEDESIAGEEMEQEETAAAEDSSNAVETSDSEPAVPSDAVGNEEPEPAEEGGPTDESPLERTEERSS
ncbi:MAG TPA: protein phosphatase 2C domain-containing protein [Propionibacteriaceae bacterium]|nr:protein phosphatase 2C domain-containing protein [Propionibacteriaceae bacterium]